MKRKKLLRLDTIREMLSDMNLSEVSRSSGIKYQTLWTMLKHSSRPNYHLVEKLSDYIDDRLQEVKE